VIPRENVANQEEIFFLLACEQDAQWRRGGFCGRQHGMAPSLLSIGIRLDRVSK